MIDVTTPILLRTSYCLSFNLKIQRICLQNKIHRIPLASTPEIQTRIFSCDITEMTRALPSTQVFGNSETRQHIRISHYRIKRSMITLII